MESVADSVDPSIIVIPNDVLSGFGFLNDLFMLVFAGLGNYQALIYVPLCIGIASIILGRGFNAASRVRPRDDGFREVPGQFKFKDW